MLAWQDRYGRLPSSYDWSRTHAHRRGGQPLKRLEDGDWPPASVVTDVFGTWATARAAARARTQAAQAIIGGDHHPHAPAGTATPLVSHIHQDLASHPERY